MEKRVTVKYLVFLILGCHLIYKRYRVAFWVRHYTLIKELDVTYEKEMCAEWHVFHITDITLQTLNSVTALS